MCTWGKTKARTCFNILISTHWQSLNSLFINKRLDEALLFIRMAEFIAQSESDENRMEKLNKISLIISTNVATVGVFSIYNTVQFSAAAVVNLYLIWSIYDDYLCLFKCQSIRWSCTASVGRLCYRLTELLQLEKSTSFAMYSFNIIFCVRLLRNSSHALIPVQ